MTGRQKSKRGKGGVDTAKDKRSGFELGSAAKSTFSLHTRGANFIQSFKKLYNKQKQYKQVQKQPII